MTFRMTSTRESRRRRRLRQRLDAEQRVLAEHFPSFIFHDLDTPTGRVDGVLTSNTDTAYKVRLYLRDFPDEVPQAFIMDPILQHVNGYPLAELGGDERFHVLRPDGMGHVQICHFPDRYWRSSVTLQHVILKVRVWLEAYEGHHNTGRTIDNFLAHMD